MMPTTAKDPRAEAEAAAARKTAILMISVEQEIAARLMAQLDRREQERIAREIILLEARPPSKEERERVIRDFYHFHLAQQAGAPGGPRSAQSLLEKVYPAGEAKKLIEDVQAGMGGSRFEFLRKADPSSVVHFIGDEHPQLIALIVSHLDPVLGGKILEGLSLTKQQDVVKRLAAMEPTSPQVVHQVEKALESRLSSFAPPEGQGLDGAQVAARVLNHVGRATERGILESLKDEEPELAERIKRLMFTFSDLVRVNDRGIQNLLKSVDTSRLALALKTAGPELKDKFFRNMSRRAVDRVQEEMELLGPVRVVDVQSGQNAIVDEALRLEEAGELLIEGRGGAESLVV
jgi:flagellar motor switch protein FliG